MRIEAVIFAASGPVMRETLAALIGSDCNLDLLIDDIRDELRSRPYELVDVLGDILCRNISRDVIAALRGAELIATGPRSPQPGAPHTYVTTPAFLTLWGLASLRDLPDLARLEDAGLLGKAPLPEELRGALGIRDDDDDEDVAEIDADEDGEGDEEYAGVGLFEE